LKEAKGIVKTGESMANHDNTLPRGVIFDMDGVLVDSEEFICKAACLMFEELGVNVQSEDFIPFVGTGENRYIGGVAEKYNLPIDIVAVKKRTYDIYLEIIQGALKPLPGVHEFIELCRSMKKKIAIASSADRRKVLGNLKEIGLSLDIFDTIIVGEDVVHKKPAPDIFLLAANQLQLKPEECLVAEDSVSGVTAAKQAGARCLAITTSFSQKELDQADYWASDLSNVPGQVLDWPMR
jgi:HAD superfamily hydrolase (TIGR01509 family)